MKRFKFLLLLFMPGMFTLSCSTSKSKQDNELSNTAAILFYKDSIDKSIPALEKQRSLPYSVGDYTFLVTKYSRDNRTILLVEQGNSEEYGSSEKRYYLKSKNLVLYTECAAEKLKGIPYVEKRAFYNDGIQFAAEAKKAADKLSLSKAAFKNTEPLIVDVKEAIRRYEQALNQTGQFDLSFDAIVEYPKASYIVLGHPNPNPYRSALLILKQDNFIKELINNPAGYRGRKLKMNWERKNNEYVYVSGGFK